MMDTVGSRLRRWYREDAEKPAFIFRGTQVGNTRLVLTRGQVFEMATAFGNMLLKEGIKPGQVVCNTLANSPERLITDLGCMMTGVITLNGMVHLANGNDLAKTLERGAVTAIILDHTRHPNALDVLRDRVIIRGENARSSVVPNLKRLFQVDCGGGSGLRPWLDHLSQRNERFNEKVSASDVAMLFNVAGFTAFCRLVPKTHQQLLHMGEALTRTVGLDSTDFFYNDRSLGWYNGCCCDYLARGVTRVLVDMTSPPKDLLEFGWEVCLSEQCTARFLQGPDISASLIRQELWSGRKHKPNIIVTGGMPMSKQQVSAVGVLCKTLVVLMSSAETGYISFHRFQHTAESQHFEDGDYGRPLESVGLRLVNEYGFEIPPSQVGEPGQVEVHGPQVSCHEGARGDWMRTPQVAFYNAHGNLQAVCLAEPAIIHGPYIIYYKWLEKMLQQCPGVLNLLIVPVPDPRMFQEMCACIVPQRGVIMKDQELKAFWQTIFVDAPLECMQIPKHFLFFQDLPRRVGDCEIDRTKVFLKALEKLKLI